MATNFRRYKRTGKYRTSSTVTRARRRPTLITFVFVIMICVILCGGYHLLPNEFFPFFHKNSNPTLDVEVIKNQELSIHFLELGNKYTGDCTLIKTANVEVLIDAGSHVSSIPTIKSYLDQYVTDKIIEYVIVTHAHEDHYAGFATPENTESLFDIYDVGTVIQFAQVTTDTIDNKIYANYLRELEELETRCHSNVYTAQECIESINGAKTQYQLNEGIVLEILDQCYYREVASKENNHSVCCQIIQNNEKYYLFTGDLEKSGEESLVALNELHEVELYKAGHHGSKTSSHDVLLEVIQPKIVCVCCCAGSSEYKANEENQFPAQDFIVRIAPYTDKVYVTTLCTDFKENQYESMNGNIVVYSNRTDISPTVICSNNTTVLKKTKWFTQNRKLPNAWISKSS